MTGHTLRRQYLDFFETKGSLVVPSSSLVPSDPTTLLTSAGMQPLVPYFKGEEEPPSRRLASCQKCCRTDDFDEVGVTWRHASFFEMLGNFSFGDYFKREAIHYAWEFLTRNLSIDPKLLWVTVYHEDTEAPEYWKKDIGLSDERILRFGKKDNWWGPVGRTGPCGPDSEIFYDRGEKYNTGDPDMDRPGGDGDRYGEIWNLVFQQYNQQEDGSLLALPAPGIDTGMGLERTAVVMQGVDTIHHTDLFAPIVNAVWNVRGGSVGEFSTSPLPLDPKDPTSRPLKVVADHVRAAVFMGADGITPGNTGRDYMMRRLIRRAYLTARELDLREPFLHKLVPVVARTYGGAYPELDQRGAVVAEMIRREEERFGATIEAGMTRLEELVISERKKGATFLDGGEVFHLYETYGFPPELTTEVAAGSGLAIDQEGYAAAAARHSKLSGSATGEYAAREFGNLPTEFVGYDALEAEAEILAVRPANDGLFSVVLSRSPFYAESGGQVGDSGELVSSEFRGTVLDTRKQGKTWIHSVQAEEGAPAEGMEVLARVDSARRTAIQRAHSTTHLLHAALRQHLGTHVEQRGSLVSPDRLRFDFVHFGPITAHELALVEDTVNEQILASSPVEIRQMPIAEARQLGAMALFGEKYGDIVRTVRMGDFSVELCGGTHLASTASAGFCRIVAEGGVGSNLRRLEALTGTLALRHDRAESDNLRAAAHELGGQPETIVGAAEKLKLRVRELEKQLQAVESKMAGASIDELLDSAREIGGVSLVAARAPQGLSADTLRDLAGKTADKLGGVVVLVAEIEGKVLWAVKAAPSAVDKGAHAGNLVRELAKLTGGGGGGRADFAQAGGKDSGKIEEALGSVEGLLKNQLG